MPRQQGWVIPAGSHNAGTTGDVRRGTAEAGRPTSARCSRAEVGLSASVAPLRPGRRVSGEGGTRHSSGDGAPSCIPRVLWARRHVLPQRSPYFAGIASNCYLIVVLNVPGLRAGHESWLNRNSYGRIVDRDLARARWRTAALPSDSRWAP